MKYLVRPMWWVGCFVLLMAGAGVTIATSGGCGFSGDSAGACGGDAEPVRGLPPLTAEAKPRDEDANSGWSGSPGEPLVRSSPPGGPEVVDLYLDLSGSMAGFLPQFASNSTSVAFPFTVQNLTNHMAREFGSASAPIQWTGVDQELQDMWGFQAYQLERGMFDGQSTQLDLAVERMLANFRSGRAEAAALITDLIATHSAVGPLELLRALRNWLDSHDVQSGVFHIGLFGMKAEYWVSAGGVQEIQQKRPVYVLVLGRGAEKIESVMESLEATVADLNNRRGGQDRIESRWELLTRRPSVTVSCHAHAQGDDSNRSNQFALFQNDRREHC